LYGFFYVCFLYDGTVRHIGYRTRKFYTACCGTRRKSAAHRRVVERLSPGGTHRTMARNFFRQKLCVFFTLPLPLRLYRTRDFRSQFGGRRPRGVMRDPFVVDENAHIDAV